MSMKLRSCNLVNKTICDDLRQTKVPLELSVVKQYCYMCNPKYSKNIRDGDSIEIDIVF